MYGSVPYALYAINSHWQDGGICTPDWHKQAKLDDADAQGWGSPCQVVIEDFTDSKIFGEIHEPGGMVALVHRANPIMTLYKLAEDVYSWGLCPACSIAVNKSLVCELNAIWNDLPRIFGVE